VRRVEISAWEAGYLAITVFAVLWVSALGILLGVLGAMHGFYEGKRWFLAVSAVLAVIALAFELAELSVA
jgi:hypothetical protein